MIFVGIGVSFEWRWGWFIGGADHGCDNLYMVGPIQLLFNDG